MSAEQDNEESETETVSGQGYLICDFCFMWLQQLYSIV